MHNKQFEQGFRDFEYDWTTRNNMTAHMAETLLGAGSFDTPVLKGTNRRVQREYRVGRLEHDTPTEGNKAKLILLVRMYALVSTVGYDPQAPRVWGVSYYKPEGIPRPSRKLRDMLGKDAVPTPLENYPTPWRCPEGYQEYKHQFWSEREARQYYECIRGEWRDY